MGLTVGVEVKAQFWGKRDTKGVLREKGWIVHLPAKSYVLTVFGPEVKTGPVQSSGPGLSWH